MRRVEIWVTFTKEEKTGNCNLNQITETPSIQFIIKKKNNYAEITPLCSMSKLQLLDKNIEAKLTLYKQYKS